MLTFLLCCLPSADMEAQKQQQQQQSFQDPLSAAAAEVESGESSANCPNQATGLEAPSLSVRDSPALSLNRHPADGSEGMETTADKNDGTDSSSTWSPEVLQPDVSDILCYLVLDFVQRFRVFEVFLKLVADLKRTNHHLTCPSCGLRPFYTHFRYFMCNLM